MKISTIFYTLSLALFLQVSFGQAVLKKADRLIEDQKYASAYALLEDKDPQNTKPQIVLKKCELALDYFATSIMHQTFAFKDLEEGEDLMQVRMNSEGQTFTLYVLEIQEILDTLLLQNPKNYKLNQTLGKFYYEVYLKYGDNWLMTSQELLEAMYKNNKRAVEHGYADFLTYYGMGFYQTLNEEYAQAIPYYKESIKRDTSFPTSQYNLAICYLYEDSAQEGISYAKKAIALYLNPALKADAARLVGVLYKDLQQPEDALPYIKISNELVPNNYYTIRQLLDIEVALNLQKDAYQTAGQFFELNPTNPTILSEMFGIYTTHSSDSLLFPLLNAKLEQHQDDYEIVGNIYFHLGQYFISVNDVLAARRFLAYARKNFRKVFPVNHEAFKLIDDYLEKTRANK